MTNHETEPVCKFEQGCHRVAPCDPGCAAPAAVSVPPPAPQAAARRARYAAAIADGFAAFDADTTSDAYLDAELLDAVVAVADAEEAELLAAVSAATNRAALRCAVCQRVDDGSHPAVCFPPAPADRAAELAKHVGRAIFALKSPAPPGSQHYRSGWDDGLEAAMEAARDELLRRLATVSGPVAGEQQNETPEAVVARVLYVAEVIEANGIGWAADSVRRACRGDAEQPRTCAHCGQVHASNSLTHFGAPGGPWYCVDRDDCRGAGGLPPRRRAAAEAPE